MWIFSVAAEEPNRLYSLYTMQIFPSRSYLRAAETGGNQGGHDDHGDHDLDGGRDVTCSHLGCLCLLFARYKT
jgi:hypothetical protein